jgi:hypothetical protein
VGIKKIKKPVAPSIHPRHSRLVFRRLFWGEHQPFVTIRLRGAEFFSGDEFQISDSRRQSLPGVLNRTVTETISYGALVERHEKKPTTAEASIWRIGSSEEWRVARWLFSSMNLRRRPARPTPHG